MGMVFETGDFVTLQSAYLRSAQDAIRQYHADALMNGLTFDRHEEEQAVEGFAQQIMVAGDAFRQDPSGGEGLPNWSRVLSAFPEFPQQLQEAAQADAAQSCSEAV
jgi:glucosyl-3-phosphoglycerate synthase